MPATVTVPCAGARPGPRPWPGPPIPAAAFAYTKGRPAIYRSSSWGQREFCANCGAQICYRDQGAAATVEINLGCLDDPTRVVPKHHIYEADRIPWFETADDLPRSAGPKPEMET